MPLEETSATTARGEWNLDDREKSRDNFSRQTRDRCFRCFRTSRKLPIFYGGAPNIFSRSLLTTVGLPPTLSALRTFFLSFFLCKTDSEGCRGVSLFSDSSVNFGCMHFLSGHVRCSWGGCICVRQGVALIFRELSSCWARRTARNENIELFAKQITGILLPSLNPLHWNTFFEMSLHFFAGQPHYRVLIFKITSDNCARLNSKEFSSFGKWSIFSPLMNFRGYSFLLQRSEKRQCCVVWRRCWI